MACTSARRACACALHDSLCIRGKVSGVQMVIRMIRTTLPDEYFQAQQGWCIVESSGTLICRRWGRKFVDGTAAAPNHFPFRTTLVYEDGTWNLIELSADMCKLRNREGLLLCSDGKGQQKGSKKGPAKRAAELQEEDPEEHNPFGRRGTLQHV